MRVCWLFLLVAGVFFSGLAQDTAQLSPPTFPLGLKPTPEESFDTRWRTTGVEELRSFDDTLATDFHLYNPAFQQARPHIYLGNLGQAMRSLVFDYASIIGYYPGFDAFENYWFTQEDVRYYRTRTPFTSLFYAFGQGNENLIGVTHSQNINARRHQRINLAVDYRRPVSQGQSQWQKAGTHSMAATGWFESRKGKYEALAAFIYNQTKNEENGGWSDPEAFEKSIYKNKRELVPVFLSNATNTWSQRNVRLQQHFYLGEKTDSSRTADRTKGFRHVLEYDNRKFRYTDEGDVSNFYTDFFIDSNRTDDNTKHWMLTNTLTWEQKLSAFNFYTGMQYGGGKYLGLNNSYALHDARLLGGISGKADSSGISFEADIQVDYVGDILLQGGVEIPFNNFWKLEVGASAGMISPTDREDFYFSNHFAWDNSFGKTTALQSNAGISFVSGEMSAESKYDALWRFSLNLESHSLGNYIYFNTLNQPAQLDGFMQVLVGGAHISKAWRHIGWKAYAWLQWSSREAVQLPLFLSRQSVYYKGGFIKGKVKANLGLDIWYHTPYFADAWNPATATFHRQDEEKLKTYPTVDVFFDIQIKRARLFFMVQHVNQGLFKPGGYYVAPGFAAQDRAFKMGASWQFYD